ncbi:MAG: LON peptidase substrate-binding domain-containing protein, partial [Desulfovibrio sp.]|nr:LON peptidase substrate-binding domain-containing protein [Desulfovibrio sp.]
MADVNANGSYDDLPLMPLRGVVMYPRSIMPLYVGREISIKSIELAQTTRDRLIFLVTQRETDEAPGPDNLCPVGVVGRVLQLLRLPEGSIKVLFEGICRASWR